MKSIPNMLIAAGLACLTAGCGQPGPLYLPAKPAPAAAPTNSSAPSNTPASK